MADTLLIIAGGVIGAILGGVAIMVPLLALAAATKAREEAAQAMLQLQAFKERFVFEEGEEVDFDDDEDDFSTN